MSFIRGPGIEYLGIAMVQDMMMTYGDLKDRPALVKMRRRLFITVFKALGARRFRQSPFKADHF